jgi:hypothetical protein
MQCFEVENGKIEPIAVFTGRTGQTVEIRICRQSDGFFLDWSDDTFKAVGGVVTLDETLTAKDATNAPGIYELATVGHPTGLDTSLLGLSKAVDHPLLVIANVTAGPAFATTKIDPSTLKIICLIDACVDRKTVQSRINAMARGKIELSGASAKPAQDAVYYDEKGTTVVYTTRNTGDERNPV